MSIKKGISFLLAALVLFLPLRAFAAEFSVDEFAVVDGMEKSIYQGYTPSIQNNTMHLYLPLTAENHTGEITVSLATDDPNVYLFAQTPKSVTVSPKDGIYPVKLSLPLARNRRNGDYPATITISSTDTNGDALTETFPYVLRIRDGYASHETLKPVISDVVASFDVGSVGYLRLTVTNPTTTLSLTDGEITICDASGDILPAGSERVEIGEILPGESRTVTIPTNIRANAAIALHTVEISLNYHVLDHAETWKERFTLPVTQEIRLENGEAELTNAVAGDLSSMTLPLMNMGKGEVCNVLVKLEVDGVINEQSVLVGTIASGESKQAKLSFTPKDDSVGTHSGTVTITCEDSYGNCFEKTLEVTLRVDAPIVQEESDTQAQTESSSTPVALILLCIALCAALIAQGTILTKRIHRMEEEQL